MLSYRNLTKIYFHVIMIRSFVVCISRAFRAHTKIISCIFQIYYLMIMDAAAAEILRKLPKHKNIDIHFVLPFEYIYIIYI